MNDLSLSETLHVQPTSDQTLTDTVLAVEQPGSASLSADRTRLDATHHDFDARSLPASAAALALRRSTILPHAEVVDGDRPRLVQRERDRYETRRELGSGAGGQVVLVHDNDIERDVAMKRLKQPENPAAVARFVEEIRTVGSLEHPNIVPIHDVGQDPDGAYYFIMKYVEGETLESIIERLAAGDAEAHARYPFDVRARIFLEILRAVQFAHARGFVHRDLKPANVMVGPYGEVMVMDWGLARRLCDGPEQPCNPGQLADADGSGYDHRRLFATRHGTLLGTPAYMSPEQAAGRNDEVDQRSDIYALGVIFHEFLTLRHYLADRDTLQAMLFGVTSHDAPLAVLEQNPHQPPVPMELRHFCRHAMAKNPAERYASVELMMLDLQLRLSGHFAVECPCTFTKRALTRTVHAFDRAPVLGMSVAIVLLMLVLGSLAFSLYTLAS